MPKNAFKQGDIVLLPFPYSDLTSTKKRPAIVLSNDAVNQHILIVAAITSVIRNDSFSFQLDPSDLAHPLPKNSEVRTNIVFSAHHSLVAKRYSSLNFKAFSRLSEKVRAHISP